MLKRTLINPLSRNEGKRRNRNSTGSKSDASRRMAHGGLARSHC